MGLKRSAFENVNPRQLSMSEKPKQKNSLVL